MQYEITHTTKYDYGDVVPECFNIVRLSPRKIDDQICHDHRLIIDPEPSEQVPRVDFFGNSIEQFTIHAPHSSLTVTAKTKIKVTARAVPELVDTPEWEMIADKSSRPGTLEALEAAQLSFDSAHIRSRQDFAEYARESFTNKRPIMDASLDLTRRIHQDFIFDPEATTVSTPVEEVFKQRRGVCQDFAHFQISCLRSLNLPARYVSGYLRTIPPPGKARLIGADASHAWVGVYGGPKAGWIDFDPTNNVIPSTDHITIGWGRDYADVCPIQGVFTGGGQTIMSVSVDVAPVKS